MIVTATQRLGGCDSIFVRVWHECDEGKRDQRNVANLFFEVFTIAITDYSLYLHALSSGYFAIWV
jgi:hypothetical protein